MVSLWFFVVLTTFLDPSLYLGAEEDEAELEELEEVFEEEDASVGQDTQEVRVVSAAPDQAAAAHVMPLAARPRWHAVAGGVIIANQSKAASLVCQ